MREAAALLCIYDAIPASAVVSHARGGCLTFENVLPLRAHVHNRDTAHSIGKRLSLPSGRRMLANQTLEEGALSLYAQAAGVLCQKATLPALAGNAGAPCLLRQKESAEAGTSLCLGAL